LNSDADTVNAALVAQELDRVGSAVALHGALSLARIAGAASTWDRTPSIQRLIRTSGGQVSTLVPATVGDVADRGFSGCLPAFNGDDGPLHAPQYQVPS
jgi:hypothetical protein